MTDKGWRLEEQDPSGRTIRLIADGGSRADMRGIAATADKQDKLVLISPEGERFPYLTVWDRSPNAA